MISVKQRHQFVLAHAIRGVGYTFFMDEDTVEVVRTTGKRGRLIYTLSIEEARQLWSRLINQGYERF